MLLIIYLQSDDIFIRKSGIFRKKLMHIQKTDDKSRQTSLCQHYFRISFLLSLFIIVSAFVTDGMLQDTSKETASNIQVRNDMLLNSRKVRNAVWNIKKSLDVFLREPYVTRNESDLVSAVSNASGLVNQAADKKLYSDELQKNIFSVVHQNLLQLEVSISELINLRKDFDRQFPGFALANNGMFPSQQSVLSAVNFALEELREENNPELSEAYSAFHELRYQWQAMVSNYRMFVANRMGSFRKEVLDRQNDATYAYHDRIQKKISLLIELANQDRIGFQGQASLSEIISSTAKWMTTFEEINKFHKSGYWRMDAKYMNEKIEPLFNLLWKNINLLDARIDAQANHDVVTYEELANTQSRTLWIIAGISLGFIFICYIALNRLILNPISQVTSALKAESTGQDNVRLPVVTSMETQELIEAFSEMRSQVRSRQGELKHQATHDGLTGLPNRSLFSDRLDQATRNARRNDNSFALMILDLDQFKEVNDTLGHHVGDAILIESGNRFRTLLREIDTVARLGGDEFGILLENATINQVETIAKKIIQQFDQPFLVESHELRIRPSIGIVVYPEHSKNINLLLRMADAAMYKSKKQNLGYYVAERTDNSLVKDEENSISHSAKVG